MADIEIDVDAGGLEELAKQGKLSADALAKFARELNALQPSNQTANKGLNELSDIIKKLNATAQGATSSGKKLAESIAEITKAAAEAKAIELQLAGALGSTKFQIDENGKSSDRAAESIRKQSSALQELIDKQKNFQLLSSTTNEQISPRATNENKLIQIRKIEEILSGRGRVFAGIPIPVEELRGKNIDEAVLKIRELNSGLNQQQLLSIRMAFAAKAGATDIKALAEAERALNIANKDVISSEGQLILSTNGRSASAAFQASQLRKARGLSAFGSSFQNIPNVSLPIDSQALFKNQQLRTTEIGLDNLRASLQKTTILASTPLPSGGILTSIGITPGQLAGAILGVHGLLGTISQLRAEVVQIISEASEFNRKLLLIKSISLEAIPPSRELGIAIAEIATNFNQTNADVAAAEFEIVSQQVAKAAESYNVLAASAKLAEVTGTTTVEASKVITGAINAFGLEAKDAQRVAGLLFKTVELGSVRLDQLADTIGRAGTVARALKIPLQDNLAIISALTRQGVTPNDAVTQTLNLFTAILKPTEELARHLEQLGFASGQEAVIGLGGVVNVIKSLDQAIGNSSQKLREFFPDMRQLRAGAGLTGVGFKELAEDIQKITAESDKMGESINKANEIFQSDAIESASRNFNRFRTEALIGVRNDFERIARIIKDIVPFQGFLADTATALTRNPSGGVSSALSQASFLALQEREKQAQAADTTRLDRTKKLALDLIKIQTDRTTKEQQENFRLRDSYISTTSEILAHEKNITELRIREIEKLARKQQQMIDLAQTVIDRTEEAKRKIRDNQQGQDLKEAAEDIKNRFRTPSQLDAIRESIGRFDPSNPLLEQSNSTINEETNRRDELQLRRNEQLRKQSQLDAQLASADLFSPDSGGVERARKLAQEIRDLAQQNLDEERTRRFALDKEIFQRRGELDAETNKPAASQDQEKIIQLDNALGQSLRKRADEENRIKQAITDRTNARENEIRVENVLVEQGKKQIANQALVNKEIAKTKDVQDALNELLSLKIFDSKGKFQFETVDKAFEKVSSLKQIVEKNTTDDFLLKQTEKAAARAVTQILIQEKISETSEVQRNLGDALDKVSKASDLQGIAIENLGKKYDELETSIRKVIQAEKDLDFTPTPRPGQFQPFQVIDIKEEAAKAKAPEPDIGIRPDRGSFSDASDPFNIFEIKKRRIERALKEVDEIILRINTQGFAEGGSVSSRDSIPALLSPGEFVTNPASTSRFFNRLVAMNNGVDPSLPSGSTRFGDINVTVSGVNNANQIADELPAAIKKVLRRGTWRN